MSFVERRLDDLYQNAQIIEFDPSEKFLFISDTHMGKGDPDDSFAPNENLFMDTLDKYPPSEWSLCLGGDIYDLSKNMWESDVVIHYQNVFHKLSQYKQLELCGNHDRELQNIYPEAYKFKNKSTGEIIFWHHGYADDILNDQLWEVSRDFMRYLLAPFEDITKIRALISPAANADRHDEVQKRLKGWANGNQITSVFGHVHYMDHDGHYWNDGCGVHIGDIEGIELVNGKLALRTWS